MAMAAGRVTLSTQLNDAEHTRPVVQGLRDLAGATNTQQALVAALVQRVGAIRVPTMAEIQQALSSTGTNPVNPPIRPGSGVSPSGTGTTIYFGSHAQRTALVLPATLPILFIETDRYALYEGLVGSSPWLFLGNVLGPFTDTIFAADNRPADLGANDAGFIFEGSDANNAWWRWSGAAWIFQIGSTGVPLEVTLSPDTRPTLTANDVGFRIWATDYRRLYVWSGAAWAEGQHNDSRYQIGFFDVAPDQNGWYICDGAVVSRSTSTAGVTNYTTPDLLTDNRFLRSANAASGTGGDATNHTHQVDPPNTTSTGPTPNTSDVDNGAGQVVMAGVGVTVAAHTHDHDLADHTHDVDIAEFASAGPSGTAGDDALPPYYEAIPYIRL